MKELLYSFLSLIIISLTGSSVLHHHHQHRRHYHCGQLISYSASLLIPPLPPQFQRSSSPQKAAQPGLRSANHKANWAHWEIKEFTFQPHKAGHTSNKYRHTWVKEPTHACNAHTHTRSDRHACTHTCPFENTSKRPSKSDVMLNASFNFRAKCMWYCCHLSIGKCKNSLVLSVFTQEGTCGILLLKKEGGKNPGKRVWTLTLGVKRRCLEALATAEFIPHN